MYLKDLFLQLRLKNSTIFYYEFNRIKVEVFSVIAVQVKSIQDAIREKKDIFDFRDF